MALRKSSGSILKVGGGSRRKRGLTGSLAPTKPRLYDLEYQQLTEDFRDGLIGYKAYSEYLTEKMGTLQPDTLEWFSIKKKIDNITFQQIDKQMDYGFRVAKNITPDDYISWKEKQLEDIDPESNEYMQLQTDIKSAKTEKISRERSSLEFDILMETKNKEDLAKFYLNTANDTDDPESQMKYYGLYSKTVDGINADILKEERSARALEEKEMRLKFNRGDLGKTFEENIEAYHNFVAGQYESEFDPSRQMTYMSQLDSLTRQYEDFQSGLIKKAEQEGVAYNKRIVDKFNSDRKNANSQMEILKKELNIGNLNSEEYSQQMMELFMGEDGYINSLNTIALDPNLSASAYEKLEKEFNAIQDKFDTDGFWKANMPVPDENGNWSGQFFTNPNYKPVQEFDSAGNVKTSWNFDPSQSYEMEDAVWDAEAKVWRKINVVKSKNEKGEKITTKEIFRLDKDGEVIKETFDEETKQWKTLGAEGFESLDRRYRDANTSIMSDFARQEYIQKKGKEAEDQVWLDLAEEQGMAKATLARHMATRPEGVIAKAGDLGGDLQAVAKSITDKVRSDFSRESFRQLPEDIAKIDRAGARFIESKTEGLKTLAEESKARFIGEKGKAVKDFQEGLVGAGLLAKKFATGFFGPESQKAASAVKQKVQEDFSREKFQEIPRDIKTIGTAISGAAKKYFTPRIEEKVKPLQQVMTPLKDKIKPFKGISAPINKKIQEFTKPFSEGIKSRFTVDKFKQIPSDIKSVGSYVKSKVPSFLKKLKFWEK